MSPAASSSGSADRSSQSSRGSASGASEQQAQGGPRWLYMHGFASGPESSKGVALAKHYAARGVDLVRLDGRKPSFEHLRLSAILDEMTRAIGGASDRAVVFGSSLGGLAAARLAERDPRVCALVLLAPAFRFVEQRMRTMTAADLERWRTAGFVETDDWSTGGKSRVDYGFFEDVRQVDAANGGWPDVRVPTLVVHGREDTVCDLAVTREWCREMRWVRLVEVDDTHELTQSLPIIEREADAFLAPFLGRDGHA